MYNYFLAQILPIYTIYCDIYSKASDETGVTQKATLSSEINFRCLVEYKYNIYIYMYMYNILPYVTR